MYASSGAYAYAAGANIKSSGSPVEGTSKRQTPIKQYEIYHPGIFQTKRLEIRQNGSTLLFTNKRGLFSPPEINIQQDEQTILASMKLKRWHRGGLLHLGNPDLTNKDDWRELTCANLSATKYSFVHEDRTYTWTSTRNKELYGASRFGGRDFKLVEQSSGVIQMVFRFNNKVFGRKGIMAEIDFYEEMEEPLELLSIAAILGIQEIISRGMAGGGGG